MNGDMEFSFEMSNKEIERIKNILTSGGLRHYLLEIADDEELDVVEYKEYQKLEKENQELEKQLEEYKRLGFKHLNDKCNELENQQKEFIEYMNKTIERLECDDVDDEEIKGYLIQRTDTFKEILSEFKEILSEFKEIIGNDINVGSKGGKDE